MEVFEMRLAWLCAECVIRVGIMDGFADTIFESYDRKRPPIKASGYG